MDKKEGLNKVDNLQQENVNPELVEEVVDSVETQPRRVVHALEKRNPTDIVVAGIENSTESLDAKAETLCRWAAGRAGVIVLTPVLGTISLMANEVYLVNRIAKLYNVKLSDSAICSFIGAFGGKIAGSLLATIIPFGVVQMPIAVGVTYAVGKVAHVWIKDGMPADMTPYIEMFKMWTEKAKEEAKILAQNPLKDIPLGDEKKDYLREQGERIGKNLNDVREKVFDIVGIAKEVLANKQENISESANDLREKASLSAAELRELASERAEVIKERAEDSVERLREKSQDAALGGADLLAELAEKMSHAAEKARQKLEERKADEALDKELKELKYLVEEARLLADELRDPSEEDLSEINEGGSELDDLIRDALKDASEAEERERKNNKKDTSLDHEQ